MLNRCTSALIATIQCCTKAAGSQKLFEIAGKKLFLKKVEKIFVGIKNDTIFDVSITNEAATQ